MGILNKIFNVKKSSSSIEQNFKHNIYDSEISQYSSLPRYYYIQGKRYDIDSPESVSSIPLCKTDFNINEEHWGIDAILREHVNRYYGNIPEELKSACYPKISDFEWSEYKTESNAEKEARLKQEREKSEHLQAMKSITIDDIEKLNITQYKFSDIIYDNNMALMLVTPANQNQVLSDIKKLNSFISDAIVLAKIKKDFSIPVEDIVFSTNAINIGKEAHTQYYTYFECVPYTKTGKISKFPLILHYGTKNLHAFNSDTNFWGKIHYMQDGTIGKAELVNWISHNCYVINLGLIGTTLSIKSVTTNNDNGKQFLYKAK